VNQIRKVKSAVEWLPISVLNGDSDYQRPLNDRRVQTIMDNFDADAFGILTVSRRVDGSYWLIDGNHRKEALLRMGWKGNQQVECKVFRGLSPEQEAELFCKIDDYLNLGYLDRFHARVMSEEPRAVAIQNIISNAGFEISKSLGMGKLSAVQACEYVYTGRGTLTSGRDHAGALKATLEVIRTAWGLRPEGVRGAIIHGIGLVFLRDGDAVDRANLSSKLACFEGGPDNLIGLAKGFKAVHGGRVTDAVSELVIATYNKGRRVSQLEAWRRMASVSA
jgi:hypothetical protein